MKCLIYAIVLTTFVISVSTEKTTLYVGALLELSNHWYQKYVNFFGLILEHVFEEVDNRTDILPNYSLKLIKKDTEGKSGLAAQRMFELMTDGPPVVAVIGPTLSPELTVVGQITPFYNVVQLSYIAMTSSTIDKDLFPYLFMVNQILNDLNPLRIKMMQYLNWNRVGTIFVQSDISVSHMNMFHDLLKQFNMTLVTSAVVPDKATDIKDLIARLIQYDVRIIMGSFGGTKSRMIFCEAYKQGLYGSNYVWVLAGPLMIAEWIEPADFVNEECTYEQYLTATYGHFRLNHVDISYHDEVTIANLTPNEITDILKAKLAETNLKLSNFYPWVYDAAWALAVGLNNSLQYLNESGLQDYTNSPYYLNAILNGMRDVNFVGMSGPLSFDAGGRRIGVNYIQQNFNTSGVNVAMHNGITDTFTWLVPPESLFPGGEIPQDRFTYSSVMAAPNIPSLVLITIGNSACFIVAVGFLIFNIYYRKKSNIKLSSPMINNIIIAGSILMFTCVFFTALDYGHVLPIKLEGNICMLRVWIMCLGFTCLFGALFSKTWRVHILFRDNQLKKKTIKDFHLFGIIGFLLLFDCIVLILWTSTHGLQKESVVRKTKDLHNQNNIIAEVHAYCYHQFEGYWFVTIYIYKGLLLAFGTFLAWETRHVTVPALNDSKYIGFCIYNVVIVCVFGVPLTHVLPTEQTTLNFVLLSALVMFCTTMCLCILFIPKGLYRGVTVYTQISQIKIRNKVNGKFIVESSFNNLPSNSASGSQQKSRRNTTEDALEVAKTVESTTSGKTDTLNAEELKNEINRIRMQIEAETTEIEHLNRLLIQTTGKDSFYKVKNDTNKVLAKQTGKNSEEAPGTCKQVLVSQDQCEA